MQDVNDSKVRGDDELLQVTDDEQPLEDEMRNLLRLKRTAVVQLTASDDRSLVGKLRDISLESLYMYVDESAGTVGDDETIKVTIFLENEGSDLTISLNGRVIRRDGRGVVVKFEHHLKWWPLFTMFPVAREES